MWIPTWAGLVIYLWDVFKALKLNSMQVPGGQGYWKHSLRSPEMINQIEKNSCMEGFYLCVKYIVLDYFI